MSKGGASSPEKGTRKVSTTYKGFKDLQLPNFWVIAFFTDDHILLLKLNKQLINTFASCISENYIEMLCWNLNFHFHTSL